MIHAFRYTKELEKAGFSKEQAEKSIQIWMDLMDQNFATKADFKEHYFMTRNDLVTLEQKIKVEMNQRFNKVDDQFNKIDDQFNKVDNQFNKVDDRFSGIDKRLDSIEAKFEKLESSLIIKLGIMMAASISIVAAIVSI